MISADILLSRLPVGSSARTTFGLPAKLGAPVPNVRNHLVIYPWEYRYSFDGDGGQPVTISSPVRWVLAYGGDFTLSNLMACIGCQSKRCRGYDRDICTTNEHDLLEQVFNIYLDVR